MRCDAMPLFHAPGDSARSHTESTSAAMFVDFRSQASSHIGHGFLQYATEPNADAYDTLMLIILPS
jgi:hypothetical protein